MFDPPSIRHSRAPPSLYLAISTDRPPQSPRGRFRGLTPPARRLGFPPLCRNGSHQKHLPKWQFAIARDLRVDLRKLGASPQFFPTCARSTLAQVGIFSALFCAS